MILTIINHMSGSMLLLGVKKFCDAVKNYDDLYEEVKSHGKVKCD